MNSVLRNWCFRLNWNILFGILRYEFGKVWARVSVWNPTSIWLNQNKNP